MIMTKKFFIVRGEVKAKIDIKLEKAKKALKKCHCNKTKTKEKKNSYLTVLARGNELEI